MSTLPETQNEVLTEDQDQTQAATFPYPENSYQETACYLYAQTFEKYKETAEEQLELLENMPIRPPIYISENLRRNLAIAFVARINGDREAFSQYIQWCFMEGQPWGVCYNGYLLDHICDYLAEPRTMHQRLSHLEQVNDRQWILR